MSSQTEDREWSDPGVTSSSFWNPAGPFRPLRRIVMWSAGGLFVLAVLLFAAGAGNLALVAAFSIPTTLTAWAVLWFIDTILAFVKD